MLFLLTLIIRELYMSYYENKSKEEFKMSGFVLLTLSFTVAILLAGVISTVIVFELMGNAKFVKWLMGKYMKTIEASLEEFVDDFKEVGV